ncbi:alpha/beta hydrolase [Aestuariivivens insulae]|uniref:alpha/beta hydrolase n=1 Tax=Aestuariivivens insulae TaxID=1621988 RepID=UPI001F59F486|nr:dienelactone hydrolase family protein [Aestuariivivens insulae]
MKKIVFLLLTIVNCVVSNSQTATHEKTAALDTGLPLVSEEVYQALAQFFEYDKNIPLNAKIISKDKFEGCNKEKLMFTGVNNSKVPAYLITPNNGEDKHPIVFLVDGIYGSKERWLQDDSWPKGGLVTKAFLDKGFAVITLDAVYHGERAYENDFNPPPWPRSFPYEARQMFMQTAVEYRRALDYISTRNDIDASRIGFLGLSMGGLITFEITSTDSRIKTAVAGLTPIWKNPEYQPWAPYTYAGHIKCNSFLMFMGNKDPVYTMEDAHQLFDLIPLTEKDFVEYSVKHEPPKEYVKMVTDWFINNL